MTKRGDYSGSNIGAQGRPAGHGMSGTPTYTQWCVMKQSVNNPKSTLYKYIGAKGIGYVPEWDVFENFLADMGVKPRHSTLQRIDRDKGFSPANCVWGEAP